MIVIEGYYLSIVWTKENVHLVQLKEFSGQMQEVIGMNERGFTCHSLYFGGYDAMLFTDVQTFSDISLPELQRVVKTYLNLITDVSSIGKIDPNFDER